MQATQVQQTGMKGATHRQHSCSTQATQVQHTGNPGGAVNTGAGNTVVTIRQKRCNKHATQVQHMDNTGATTDRPSTCAFTEVQETQVQNTGKTEKGNTVATYQGWEFVQIK